MLPGRTRQSLSVRAAGVGAKALLSLYGGQVTLLSAKALTCSHPNAVLQMGLLFMTKAPRGPKNS